MAGEYVSMKERNTAQEVLNRYAAMMAKGGSYVEELKRKAGDREVVEETQAYTDPSEERSAFFSTFGIKGLGEDRMNLGKISFRRSRHVEPTVVEKIQQSTMTTAQKYSAITKAKSYADAGLSPSYEDVVDQAAVVAPASALSPAPTLSPSIFTAPAKTHAQLVEEYRSGRMTYPALQAALKTVTLSEVHMNDYSLKGIVRRGTVRQGAIARRSRPCFAGDPGSLTSLVRSARARRRGVPGTSIQKTSLGLCAQLDAQADRAADAMLFGSLGAEPMTREQQSRLAKGLALQTKAKRLAAKKSPLKTAARAGARIAAKSAPSLAKAKATASAKKSIAQKGIDAFSDVFSGKASWVSATRSAVESISAPVAKAYGMAREVASAVGISIPAPLEKEVASLNDKLIEARKNGYIAQSYIVQVVNPLLRMKTPEADALQLAISRAITAARDACSVAQTRINLALIAAEAAKNDILKGVIPAQALAAYGLRGRPATDAFDEARLKMQALEALISKAKTVSGTETKTVSQQAFELGTGSARAAWGTATEFGSKVADFAEESGEIATTAIQKGGEGLKTAASYANYLPLLLIAGGVLYVVSVGRATGSGVGEMFRSAGRRIERI